jgi:hypothetical protein
LIESVRLNGVNPRAYLNWAIEGIERSGGEIDHGTLMPRHCPIGQLTTDRDPVRPHGGGPFPTSR